MAQIGTFFKEITKLFIICLCLLCEAFFAQAQQGPPPAVKHSLEISRDTLIKMITTMDNSMVFSKKENVNNLPNYVGVNKYSSSLQLIGTDDDLKLAKWTFLFLTDISTIRPEVNKLGYFAYILGERNCVVWFQEKIAQILSDPSKAILEKRNFNFNRKGEFNFNPNGKTLILTFTEW